MQDHSELTHLLDQLRRYLPELAAKYHVRSLGLFGSFVRHEQRRDSDVDLLVTFDTVPGLLQFIALENELSDRLGMRVDLVMRDALKPAISEQILAEVVPV